MYSYSHLFYFGQLCRQLLVKSKCSWRCFSIAQLATIAIASQIYAYTHCLQKILFKSIAIQLANYNLPWGHSSSAFDNTGVTIVSLTNGGGGGVMDITGVPLPSINEARIFCMSIRICALQFHNRQLQLTNQLQHNAATASLSQLLGLTPQCLLSKAQYHTIVRDSCVHHNTIVF